MKEQDRAQPTETQHALNRSHEIRRAIDTCDRVYRTAPGASAGDVIESLCANHKAGPALRGRP